MIKQLRDLKWRRWVWAPILLAILILVGVRNAVKARISDDEFVAGGQPTFEVQQGPLTISVDVSGTIKAREQEELKCEVEGQTTILWIVPEGTDVEKGDLLVELDSSRLKDDLVDQEIRVQNARAAHISASENFEVTKNQAQSDVDKAELAYQFAQEDLKNYLEGEYPMDLMELEARITLAKGTWIRAKEELAGSERLFEKEFITATELEADKQALLKAELDLKLAEEDMKLLTDFTYKRTLAELESDVKQFEMALERTVRKAEADKAEAEANLRAKELEFNRQKSKYEKTQEQIEKTKIYAPTEGLVVYATTGQGSWRRNIEPLAEGQTVRERQELIYLPTASSFMAEVDVHETSLAKINKGLPVDITVEALPGKLYTGRVASVAPLPDAQSAWMNPDLKVYNTDIHLEGDTEGIRTGMSCLAKIIVEEYDDATYVPVQAVVRSGGQPTVYVVDGGKSVPRQVELGLDNNRMACIVGGLTPGERVLLAPPLAEEEDTVELARAKDERRRERATAEQPEQPEALARADAPEGRPESQDGDAMRQRFMNATPEEREKMMQQFRERFENMSPEERERMQERFRQREGGPMGEGFPTGPPPGGGERADSGERGERGGMRRGFMDATPEEREQMKKQFEERLKNMTPEEREQMRNRFRGPRRESAESEQ